MADFDWSELDKYHAYHHQSPANNPSGLVAPEASMTAPDAPMMPAAESYPDPSHVGQNRMMDIGYYQHGDNGYHGQNAGTMETHGGIEDFIADMYPDQAIPLVIYPVSQIKFQYDHRLTFLRRTWTSSNS